MEKNTIVSLTENNGELEIKVHEIAYGNLAIIGALEKIKHALITETYGEIVDSVEPRVKKNSKYEA